MICPVGRGLAAAVVVSLVFAAAAWADETITTRTPNTFASAVTTIDQGEKVTLHNIDIAGHDVVAQDTGDDGKPLFRSDVIQPGSSGPVVGTEYLVTGGYDFFCSIHPGMEARLEVTSAGTPVPRPQPGIKVRVLSRDLDRVVETRRLKLSVSSGKASVTVAARAQAGKNSITLGTKRLEFEKEERRRVKLRLSKAAAKALRKRKRAKLIATATATRPGGDTERSTARRTLD